MARIEVLQHAFNVGVFDRSSLHRVDLERMRLAAERQTNIIPDSVGKGVFRPGTEYLATLAGQTFPLDFIAGNDDAAALLLSDYAMRVFDKQTDTMVTRAAVSTSITSGDFSAGAGWTLASSAGQTTAISGGKLNMTARAHGGIASATASASVLLADQTVEHALRIIVDRGPVLFRLGSTSGGDELISERVLRTGAHSIAFTPNAGTIYLKFSSEASVLRIVDSCQIEAAGVMELPTIWPEAALELIRDSQSLDVLYCACAGYREQRIERQGNDTSWSVVDYSREDGPFQAVPSSSVQLTPGALEGNTTLTASGAFFRPGHVGAMFRLFHDQQSIDTYIAGQNQYCDAFKITGITETNFEDRKYTYTISGTWAGTIRNRRSYNGEEGDFIDYRRAQTVATIDITANASYTNDDNDDGIDVWVKLGFPPGLYTSGEARIQATYPNGGGFGICRVTAYNSPTSVDVEVLVPFKGAVATKDWRQSRYDGVMGYPAAVAFMDGRITWSGDDLFDASVSDAFDSFNEEFTGEAGPLSRSIALGGRNEVRWALPLSSLMLGCDSRVANVRASSLDEVITPDNFGMKSAGRVGAAPINAVELADDRGIFVQASGRHLYEITWSPEKNRYVTYPFSKLTTELFTSGISGLAVQVLPDQRLWVTTRNGDAVCIVFEPSQQILAAHVPISTSTDTDFFQYFCVLPDNDQDRVYAVVKRVVDATTIYTWERFARDDEAIVASNCKVMDSHVFGVGAHSTTISLPHLIGREVVAWVDGAPVTDAAITDETLDNTKIFTVDNAGEIVLPVAPTTAWCVGLRYDWEYKSARLAYGVEGYTAMLKSKGLSKIGILLGDYVRRAIKYGMTRGNTFLTPYNLPTISSATGTTADAVVDGPDEDEHAFTAGGELGLDMRVCLSGSSPNPATLRALVLAIETYN